MARPCRRAAPAGAAASGPCHGACDERAAVAATVIVGEVERYREREQTFDVDGSFSLDELMSPLAATGASIGTPTSERLRATYYDTDDLRLLRAGITLRRRVGGHDDGWHLKLPSGDPGDRTEVRLPLERSVDVVPDELAQLLTAHVRGAALRPVLALDTERVVTVVRADGSDLEVADDRVTAERLADGTVRSWREIEVERLAGGGDLAARVASLLASAGARPAAAPSKAARALEVPARASARPPATRSGDILARRLQELVSEIARQDLALRQDAPDAVHDLRVALRRTRSTLKTFSPLFSPEPTRVLRDELSFVSDVLGAARDREVLLARTEAALDALAPEERLGPVRSMLVGGLAGATAAARDELAQLLRSERYAAALESLAAFAAEPPYRPGRSGRDRTRLFRCVRREVRRVRRAVAAAEVASGERRDLAYHEARKAAKRVRYGAETLAPLAKKPARRLAKSFAAVQEVLGERHDAVVARAHFAHEGALAGVRVGENGYTYGLLAERERQAIAAADAAFAALWPRASAKELRRFLR